MQVIGPVVDVRFSPGTLPAIKNAVHIKDTKQNISVVAEVAQHLGTIPPVVLLCLQQMGL